MRISRNAKEAFGFHSRHRYCLRIEIDTNPIGHVGLNELMVTPNVCRYFPAPLLLRLEPPQHFGLQKQQLVDLFGQRPQSLPHSTPESITGRPLLSAGALRSGRLHPR